MAEIVTAQSKDFSGGVNLRDAPLNLQPNQLLSSINMEPIEAGGLKGRGGTVKYNATTTGNPIKSLFRWYRTNNTGVTLATSGTVVHLGNDATGVFTTLDSGYTTGLRFKFAAWSAKDKVYWTNNSEVVKSYDGTTVATLGGSPPVSKDIEFHQDRLWLLLDNSVRFSDLNTDDTWPAANALNVSDRTGGTSTFVRSVNRVLVIGRETGLYRLEGSPVLGGTLTKYSDVGCIAGSTAVVTDFGLIFLGRQGVYITDGYSVQNIAVGLEPLFTGYFRTAVAGYYRKKQQYWLSFSTSGGANDQLWVLSNIEDVDGTRRLAWHQYTGLNVDSISSWDGGSDQGLLHYGSSTLGHVYKADFGTQDDGVDYISSFRTRPEDFGNPLRPKQLRWIVANFEATNNIGFSIFYNFRSSVAGGLAGAVQPEDALIWGTGNWGEKKWTRASGITANTRTSVLHFEGGHYMSLGFNNTGDGPNFMFYNLISAARLKDWRRFEVFSL